MPDYPYVYESTGPRPVAPGGTRVRVLRRRDQEAEGETEQEREGEGSTERSWRQLLENAVGELNDAFRRSGVPFHCLLEEDAQGLCLHVRREGDDGVAEEVEEEVLAPSELPHWLTRFRTRLGILIDETA